MRRYLLTLLGAVLLVGAALAAWAFFTVKAAEGHLRAAEASLQAGREAILNADTTAGPAGVALAKAESTQAAELASSLIWRASTAIPVLGDSFDAGRHLVYAVDQSVTAVDELARSIEGVQPRDVVSRRGAIDLGQVRSIGSAADVAMGHLETAQEEISLMPRAADGAFVVERIEAARVTFTTKLVELHDATAALAKVGDLVPTLLGAEGQRTYFIAVQAPNETRGTGGLVGTWAVASVKEGRIRIDRVGSSGDLPDLETMPKGLGKPYRNRYGPDPGLVVNMNVSPDLPSASKLWMESWRRETGQRLDGVLAVDVNAVGALLAAGGVTLTGPDGRTVPGGQFAQFALAGIYQQFPTGAHSAARKDYQEALGVQALNAVMALPQPVAMARAMAEQVEQRRVGLWVRDKAVMEALAASPLPHALAGVGPHSVEPVIINAGWSKLDTYIGRTIRYEVGRCQNDSGQVRSTVTTILKSDLPAKTRLPDYVVGDVPIGAAGPVNQVLLQTHLPEDADILKVRLDGKPVGYTPFVEGGRPAALLALDLPPRERRKLDITFLEPGSDDAGEVLVQPMARAAKVEVSSKSC